MLEINKRSTHAYVLLCLQLMCELGNSVINHIYEGTCEEQGLKKPGANSPR